jgi:PAS domain S-box-containing protein
MVENINDQKEAELALKNSEEQFRKVFEESPLGMIFADPSGSPLDVNKSFCQMLGYTREELLQLNLQEITYPDDLAISRSIPHPPGGTQARSLEFRSLTKEGRVVWVKVVPLLMEENGRTQILSIVEDITERKQMDDMKRDLLAVVSHQLKTPVAEINGYLENLLDGVAGDLTEKQRQYLSDMREIGVENYRLISDLLNMSKIERGVASVNLQSSSLWRILELSLRDYEASIQRKGLDLRLEKGPLDLELWADQDKTVEALRNIINNALKCTDRGTISLRALGEGDFGLIEVEDTGIGMKPEVLRRLFTKERVMGTEASRSGSGLGLFIARSFMQLQGGDITVHSTQGQGSIFRVKIPKVKRSDHAQ